MSRQGLSRLLLATLLLVLTACQVEVDIDLEVAEDGSGTIAIETFFDADANAAIGDVSAQLRVADLERAGWTITTAEADPEGATSAVIVTATKAVKSANQWQPVLDEIAGPGVFNDVEVGLVDGEQTLSFELDLRDGWDLFADDELTTALDGEPFGAPVDDLANGRSIDDIVDVDVAVSVRNFSDGVPTTASFSPRFDDDAPTRVGASATSENTLAVLLRWIAIALFSLFALATVLAVTGIVLQRRSDRLRPAPTPASLASRLPGSGVAMPTAPVATSPRTDSVRLVVLEPLSVLYHQTNVLEQNLLPFVRKHGGTARADTIADGFRSLVAGSTDTNAFWDLCGVELDAADADERYVSLRKLHSGAGAFFEEMQRRRIPVAATTNDASLWSARARERDRLSAVWPWLVSSDTGAITHNVGMFEVLRRESGVAHGHCLYVDTDLESLDAAAQLGMKTALFDSGDLELPAVIGHAVVHDFKDLLRRQDT